MTAAAHDIYARASVSIESITDLTGRHSVRARFADLPRKPAYDSDQRCPMNVTLSANVLDSNQQRQTAPNLSVTVHPASVYVGLRLTTPMVVTDIKTGTAEVGVEVVVVDALSPNGRVVSGADVSLRACRKVHEYKPVESKALCESLECPFERAGPWMLIDKDVSGLFHTRTKVVPLHALTANCSFQQNIR